MASGIGRIGAIVGPFITGALVTAGIACPWGFYLFAVVAVLGFGPWRRAEVGALNRQLR